MNVLVLGARGQLGRALEDACPGDVEMAGFGHADLDITDAGSLERAVRRHRPAVIVNAAAFTAVDAAESNVDAAAAVNTHGAENIAKTAAACGSRVIHISTDFVFDGAAEAPYRPVSPTHPISAYGRTKRDGERAVLETMPTGAVILRTAWLYGEFGSNFVTTMLSLMSRRSEISVVTDQTGSPTWTGSLADIVWRFCATPAAHGVYHWTDFGTVSRYDFAVAIRDEALEIGLIKEKTRILESTSDAFASAARRPAYSVLDSAATADLLGRPQDPYRENLRRMLARLKTRCPDCS